MYLRQTDLPELLLASVDVTVRVWEHRTQDATELHRSVLCPIIVPGTQFLAFHPSSPTEPKSEYLNLTFHGVEAQNLPTCQVTYSTMSHLSWLPRLLFPLKAQGGHPLSDLVFANLPLVLGSAINYYNYSEDPAEITGCGKTLCSRISRVSVGLGKSPPPMSLMHLLKQWSSLSTGQTHLGICLRCLRYLIIEMCGT